MKEFKASTYRGKQLIDTGSRCIYTSLNEIYDKWSQAKQNAFEWCLEQFRNDTKSSCFGVGNANTYGFTASWLTVKDGECCMRIETKGNSYLVWLDR